MSNYPAAIDDASTLYNPADAFSNRPLASTLAASCQANDVTLQLTTPAELAGGPSTYGIIRLDDEQVLYTASSGGNLTGCTRGFNGTTRIGHPAGTPVYWRYVAAFDQAMQSAIIALQTALGVTGAFNFLLAAGLVTSVGSPGSDSNIPSEKAVRTAINPGVNAQTGTTYTFADGDRGKLVTGSNASSQAYTLPDPGASFISGWCVLVQNRGAGTLTITRGTSCTIDGATSIALSTNQGCLLFSDGTNYFTMRGVGSGGAGTPSGSTGDVQFNTGGAFDSDTGQLFWDKANNRLGIGTGSPSERLHIEDTLNGILRLKIRNLSNGASAFTVLGLYDDAGNTAGFFMCGSGNSGYGGASSINLIHGMAKPLALGTNDTVRILITSAGIVQILVSLQLPTGPVVTGITTSIGSPGSDAILPTEKSVKTLADTKPTGTLVTSVGSPGVDTNIPTEKAVRDAITASPSGDVTGPASSTADHIPQFNGTTGKIIKDGLALVTTVGSPGSNSSVPSEAAVRTAVNAVPVGDVVGPASATADHIPQFNGTTGKLIKDGLPLVTSIGTPGVNTNVPTEKAVRDALATLPDLVSGPVSSTDSHIPQFNGTSGKTLKDGLGLVTTLGSPGSNSNVVSEARIRSEVSSLQGQIDTLNTTVSSLQSQITALDARLDAPHSHGSGTYEVGVNPVTGSSGTTSL